MKFPTQYIVHIFASRQGSGRRLEESAQRKRRVSVFCALVGNTALGMDTSPMPERQSDQQVVCSTDSAFRISREPGCPSEYEKDQLVPL
jgi:hypothetical protein